MFVNNYENHILGKTTIWCMCEENISDKEIKSST
jgi:hypothetical protein